MPVQVLALAVVVGNTMTGIEFQAACYEHNILMGRRGADYTPSDFQGGGVPQKFLPRSLVLIRPVA